MNERRVRSTATSRGHVQHARAWWLENRDHQGVFASELEEATRLVSLLPGAGSQYRQAGFPGPRPVYLRKLACHLYCTYDDEEVIVRARRALGGAAVRRALHKEADNLLAPGDK